MAHNYVWYQTLIINIVLICACFGPWSFISCIQTDGKHTNKNVIMYDIMGWYCKIDLDIEGRGVGRGGAHGARAPY